MMSNFTHTLATLAQEINALEADRQSGNRSRQIEMGHKLILVREMLREQNGVQTGKLDPTGNYAPNGWGQWVKENLCVGTSQAAACIRYTIDPSDIIKRSRTISRYRAKSPTYLIRQFTNVWPNLNEADRDKVLRHVVSLAKGEQHADAA